jgi:hypothetical protein
MVRDAGPGGGRPAAGGLHRRDAAESEKRLAAQQERDYDLPPDDLEVNLLAGSGG